MGTAMTTRRQIQYGTGVVVLPAAAVREMPPDASYLRVLISVCADPDLLNAENSGEQIAAACGLTRAITANALDYWTEKGVLSPVTVGTSDSADTKEPPAPAKAEPAPGSQTENTSDRETPAQPQRSMRSELPKYSLEQTAAAIERSPDLRPALNMCEQMLGKIFSEHDNAQFAALYESYGLDSAYLMTLIAYCKKQKNDCAVSYVVRTALNLYDEGVRTVPDLEAKIRRRDAIHSAKGRIFSLFGMDVNRTLSSNEEKYLENWTVTWDMPMDVIKRAYDITVDKFHEPRLPYINKILSGWNDNGLRTMEAIEAEAEEHRRKYAQKSDTPADNGEHSFNTDEFLDLALKRSFKT